MIRPLALGCLVLLAAAPCVHAQAADPAANDADLADYKQRLFTVIRAFRQNTTTAADIKAIIGETFAPPPPTKGWQRWRIESSRRFRSLSFYHNVTTYMGEKPGTEPRPGEATNEAGYSVDFASTFVTPSALFADEDRCLSVAEFTAALTAAGLTYSAETYSESGIYATSPEPVSFVITAMRPGVNGLGGIFLRATPNMATLHPPAGAPDSVDMTRGCIQTLSLR